MMTRPVFIYFFLYSMLRRCDVTYAFNVGNLFGLGKAPPAIKIPDFKISSINTQKKALLEAVSFTNNGKTATPEQQTRVLDLVARLEKEQPPSSTLLTDPNEAMRYLDGVWYLQYTSPSVVGEPDRFPNAWKPQFASEGDSQIETAPFQAKGSISAQGIRVETSNRTVKQTFDIAKSRVINDIELDWGQIVVAGAIRPSPNVPNRAIVAFDTCKVTFSNGLELNLSWLFTVNSLFRGGRKDSGWLETTFIDSEVRIGRGNKGTMFVLTRDPAAVRP